MAYNSTTWSPDTLSKASETSSATLNNATLSGTLTVSGATQLNQTLTVGANTTGYDVKFFGASNAHYMLWDASADNLVLSDNAQVKVGTGSDGSFYHNGTHTYLANSTGSLFVSTTTGSLNLGTITSGVAVSIGHTTSETTVNDNLTVTGATTLNSTLTIGSDGTGHDVTFYGDTSGRNLVWDESQNRLRANDDTAITVGTGNDCTFSHTGSKTLIAAVGNLEIQTTSGTLTLGSVSGEAVSIGHTTSETTVNDNLTVTGRTSLKGTLTTGEVGENGTNVILLGESTDHHIIWDASDDNLALMGSGTKLSFGSLIAIGAGEWIGATSSGHLEINSGTTLDITAPTVDINASTLVNIDGDVDVNGTVKSGVTYTQYFGITEISPATAGYHYTLNNGMMNSSPSGGDSSSLGNGTDPATTLDWSSISSAEVEDIIAAMWYVPVDCTITEVKALATTDGTASETLRFHVMQYDLDTSSNPGDLSSGVVKASSADISSLTASSMKVSSAFTLDSADLTAGKVVIVTMEADDASDKISAQVYINYKAR
jgi:hypothetical protein